MGPMVADGHRHVNTRCIAYLSENQSRVVIDPDRRWHDKNRREVLQVEFLEKCRLRLAVEGLMDKFLKGRLGYIGASLLFDPGCHDFAIGYRCRYFRTVF